MALEIVRAEGCYLYDSTGKPYIDLISGIGVSVLGHRHPKVQAAVEQQLNQYWHTLVYGEFVLNPQVKLAELLSRQLPSHLNNVYLVNSGTEATEGAMKLAKRYSGRRQIISAKNAYHGSTQGAASLMSDEYMTQAFRPLLPAIGHIEFNNIADLAQISTDTAAVIVETVQAESGIYRPKNDYLKALRQRCTAVGALLILDEIQAGYGRTGSLFAFEQYDITPDILLLGKGFGGGMPIAAFIADQKMMESFTHNPVLGHITTGGGHPVCAAAALATLTELTENKSLIADIPKKSAIIAGIFKHPSIQEVRMAGLWAAIELADFDSVLRVIQSCLAKGVITDWFLFNNRSLRIAPPLVMSEILLAETCEKVLEAIKEVA
jgi:acetylornithine/succinyldiaminopimelate/putrescine aminotransferase